MEGRVNLFSFLRPIRSAPVALERLHTVLEYDRCLIGQTDLIPVLHTVILAAISRYMTVDPDKLQVRIHSLADSAGMRRIGGTDDRVSGTPWRWVASILVMSFVVIVALVVGYG